MRNILLSTVAISMMAMAGNVASGQPYPFDGVWGLLGTECASSGDLVPTEIDGSEIRYYESTCAITEAEPIGEAGQSWQVSIECSGEGQTWTDTEVFALYALGNDELLASIDLTSGYSRISERCG
ncbi:MAG: hypothetical protein AAF414_11440 [Pseudomonadota bacterium]